MPKRLASCQGTSMTEMVQSAFRELSGNGDGSLDHSALLKYYSARTGVKLKEEERLCCTV